MKKLHFRIVISILALSLFLSCRKESEQKKSATEISTDMLAKIKSMGFSTNGIVKVKDGYLVERDIFLSDKEINTQGTSKTLIIAKSEQYRTNNIVQANASRTITISTAGLQPNYVQAVDEAINRYNALNLRLRFQRIAANGEIGIINEDLGNIAWASAGFPDEFGNPYSQIKLNVRLIGNAPDPGFLASTIAHELGHCVGFRHTDYFNRTYSCGNGGNEGDAGIGAIYLPGTPTAEDPNSWMLACNGGVNRPFNANDIIALNSIYGNSITSGWMIGVAVYPNGTILGNATDKQLYTRTTLNSPWMLVANSGYVTGVAIMGDGTIVGIGVDKELWTRATLTSPWVHVPNSGNVVGITIMQNGTILGIGTDKQLYTRATLNSPWVLVPNSGSMVGVAIMQNGTILGAGTDNQLYTRATLNSPWVQVPNSGNIAGIAIMPDGTILGVGTDNQLYTRQTLNSSWVLVPR